MKFFFVGYYISGEAPEQVYTYIVPSDVEEWLGFCIGGLGGPYPGINITLNSSVFPLHYSLPVLDMGEIGFGSKPVYAPLYSWQSVCRSVGFGEALHFHLRGEPKPLYVFLAFRKR